MSEATSLEGPRTPPKSGTAKQLVIFLHGVGSDGNDLIQLAPLLQDILPDAEFVSPHGPFPFDLAPMGRQWFSLRDDSASAISREVAENYHHVDAFLDAELDRSGLTADKVALVGFSQGGMMALQTALRRQEPVGALLGLSTVLPNPATLGAEIASRPPVLLTHGDHDPVLPVSFCHQAEDALQANHVPVEKHILAGRGHEIDQEGLGYIRDFLQRHLAPA